MNIYAIIVTYNAMPWIDRCLGSLTKSTVPVVPIVVDNMSADGSRDYIPSHYSDSIIWLPQEENWGFGKGNNIGIEYAMKQGADYVLLLNQDASLAPDAIEKMMAASDGKSLVSPMQLNGDGSAIDTMFYHALKSLDSILLYDVVINKILKDSYKAHFTSAACWLIPSYIIKKVGGFNPLFFHYAEDWNYYHRLCYHKIGTIIAPKALMYHDRKVHGHIEVYNRKMLKRRILLAATNINKSFAICTIEAFILFCKTFATDLFKNRHLGLSLIADYIAVIAKTPKILSHRKIDKTEGTHWLNF